MESLNARAERALLGALIADPDLAERLDYLRPDDFANPRHRAVLAGLARIVDDPVAGTGQRYAEIAMATGGQVTPAYVKELASACPDREHAAAYGAMVLQARLARQLVIRAGELADQSAALGRDARRVIAAGGYGGNEAEASARHLSQVAAVLIRHAAKFGPPQDQLTTVARPRSDRPSASAPGPAAEQLRREEQVLSALLQEHSESGQVLSFLPVSAFTSEYRQEIFQAIRALDTAGKPVDELTVDWELAQRGITPADSTAAYVSRLAHADIGTDSPVKDAHALRVRLERRTRSAVQSPGDTPSAVAFTEGNPRPQLQLVQPPPDAVTTRPGPEHAI